MLVFGLTHGIEALHGIDFRVTGVELNLQFAPEYNRTFLFCWDISAIGALALNNRHSLRAGIALGQVGRDFELKLLAGGEAAPFARVPVYFDLAYKYNGIPEFEYRLNSLRFMTSFRQERWGVSLGAAFKFHGFFGEYTTFEPALLFSAHAFFIKNESFRFGMNIRNFTEFSPRILDAFSYNFNTLLRLNERVSLINEVELLVSGSGGLAANFYSFVYRGGVLISW